MGDKQDSGAEFGKKKKKTKQTLSLQEFQANTGSWADEADLPDAPYAPAEDTYGRGAPAAVALPTGPRATRGPQLPTKPPWTAFLGNLPYEASDEMIRDFFEGCAVANVRLLRDRDTQRLKGFGYVEFETVEDLERAIEFNERNCNGRPLRVDVAEGREDRGGAGGFSRADEASGWRRAGEGGGGGGFGGRGGFGDRDGGRGYGDREGGRGYGDRDGGRGYGDRDGGRGFGRGGFGDRDGGRGGYGDRDGGRGYGDRDGGRGYGDRDGGRGYGDRDGGRGYGRGGFGDRDGGRGGYGDRDGGRGDREGGWGREGFGGDRGSDRDGGFRRRDSRERQNGGEGYERRDSDGAQDKPAPAAQAERPRLKLKPRSVDAPVGTVSDAAKPDIFGGAKPNDVLAAEKKLQEERAKRKEDGKTVDGVTEGVKDMKA